MNVLSAILSSFILPAELKKIFLLKSFVFYPVPREPPLALSFCVFLRKNRDTEVLPDILRVWQRIIRRGGGGGAGGEFWGKEKNLFCKPSGKVHLKDA